MNDFSNPLIKTCGLADPWICRIDDIYYLTGTSEFEDRILVWSSAALSRLDDNPLTEVWRTSSRASTNRQIWAPELHEKAGRCVIYFSTGDGDDDSYRIHALESDTPLGPYRDAGLVDSMNDNYAIDGSVLTVGDTSYWMYAAKDGLWITEMINPLRAGPKRVKIAQGDQDWERAWVKSIEGWRMAPFHWIEAPQALLRDGRVFVTYSAGHSATPHYAMGLLECCGDPLTAASWRKFPGPVFAPVNAEKDAPPVLTVGHASFTRSADGNEDWIVYHGKDFDDGEFFGRTTRCQRFYWNPDGTPDFGRPIPAGCKMGLPFDEAERSLAMMKHEIMA